VRQLSWSRSGPGSEKYSWKTRSAEPRPWRRTGGRRRRRSGRRRCGRCGWRRGCGHLPGGAEVVDGARREVAVFDGVDDEGELVDSGPDASDVVGDVDDGLPEVELVLDALLVAAVDGLSETVGQVGGDDAAQSRGSPRSSVQM